MTSGTQDMFDEASVELPARMKPTSRIKREYSEVSPDRCTGIYLCDEETGELICEIFDIERFEAMLACPDEIEWSG